MDLAREQGVSKTALALGVGYYRLRKRLAAAGPERRSDGPAGGFVELPPWAVRVAPVCVLELTDRDGTRLRVELQGPARAGLESLARALWSRTRCSR